MQSNREVFQEMREQDCDNIPPAEELEETKTQAYHNRPRKEGEAVLMDGGYYRMDFIEHYVLFILEKYTAKTFMLYFDRAVRSSEIEVDHIKGRWKTDTLGNIKPATHEEEDILKRPLQGDFMGRWADSVNTSLYGNSKRTSGLKALSEVESMPVYHNHAKPLTDVQKLYFIPEISEETKKEHSKILEDGFKNLRSKMLKP